MPAAADIAEAERQHFPRKMGGGKSEKVVFQRENSQFPREKEGPFSKKAHFSP
jgi:hypothetical protein